MSSTNKQQLIEQRILAQHQLIADRLCDNPQTVIAHARANLKRWSKQYSDTEFPIWFLQWQALLDKPVDEIASVLTSTKPEDIQLRSSSPFAGVLTAKERWALIKNIQ